MPESDLVFVGDTAITNGFHGETAFLFDKNEPVPNNEGVESFVFEDNFPIGSAPIQLENFRTSDREIEVEQTLTLRVDAVNVTANDQSFTVEWKEDGSVIGSETTTIPADSTEELSFEYTRSTTGLFNYSVNEVAPIAVAWLKVGPSDLTAAPAVLELFDGQETTTIEQEVTNNQGANVDYTWELTEDGDVIYTNTKTITTGSTVTFSHSVTYTSAQRHEYQANGRSNVESVIWLEEASITGIPAESPDAVLNYVNSGTGQSATGTVTTGSGGSVSGGSESPGYRTGSGGSKNIQVTFSTEGNVVEDCTIIYDWSNLSSDNYTRVEIFHGGSQSEHNWVVGTYDTGTHDYPIDRQFFWKTEFNGRFYSDGRVTDLNNNQIGVWK